MTRRRLPAVGLAKAGTTHRPAQTADVLGSIAARKRREEAFTDFVKRLTLLISKNRPLITVTLSNIFTMRLIGNKTHGDMAEIAVSEFINQYMYDFEAVHVGKDLYS